MEIGERWSSIHRGLFVCTQFQKSHYPFHDIQIQHLIWHNFSLWGTPRNQTGSKKTKEPTYSSSVVRLVRQICISITIDRVVEDKNLRPKVLLCYNGLLNLAKGQHHVRWSNIHRSSTALAVKHVGMLQKVSNVFSLRWKQCTTPNCSKFGSQENRTVVQDPSIRKRLFRDIRNWLMSFQVVPCN